MKTVYYPADRYMNQVVTAAIKSRKRHVRRKVVKVEPTGIGVRGGMGGLLLTLECGHTVYRFVATATQNRGKIVRHVECDKCPK